MIGTAGAFRDARECQANCAVTVREIAPDASRCGALGSGLCRPLLPYTWLKTAAMGPAAA
jgi:hypothetical protein